ncbi:MAG: hypothetical protein OXU61_13125 [Gammaproteobacteria bacterium]|nr:hypothetical protein [Gammaproteobacteria bacterium]
MTRPPPGPPACRQAPGEPLPSWRAYLQSAYAVCRRRRFAPASRRAPPQQWRRHLQDND